MIKRITTVLFIMLFAFFLVSCGGVKSEKTNGVEVSYSTNAKKSVPLPDTYPKDKFPIYQDSFVSGVENEGENMVVVCFSKDSVEKVTEYYKSLLKNAQILSNTETEDEYMSMGIKDGFTYSVTVGKNDETEDLKGYITYFGITLIPAEPGMEESLQQFPGALPNNIGSSEQSGISNQNEGECSLAEDVSLPQGYPQDILPIYGGSATSVEAAMSSNNKGMIGFQTKKEPQQVQEFYRNKLCDAADFKEEKKGNRVILTASKDGYNFRIMLMANVAQTGIDMSYKTLVQMEYSKK